MPILTTDPLSGLPMVYQGGEYRVLAALPSPPLIALPDYAAANPVLPESEWKETDLRWLAAQKRRDQKKTSACTGYSTTTAARYVWKLTQNQDYMFSPQFLYSLICGGVDRGAPISAVLEALLKYGCCFEPTVPELTQGCYQVSQLSRQAFEEALRFRFDAYRVRSFQELCSGLHLGFLGVTGVAVGNNLVSAQNGNLDVEGCCPLPDYVAGGHALPIIGLKKGKRTGRWLLPVENSWSNYWGDDGFAALEERHFNPAYGFPFDTFLIRASLSDPKDPNPDPILAEA
jgi:hypothetical protein